MQPQYLETYCFDATADDGVKPWVNDQVIIDHWTPYTGADQLGGIAPQAGCLHDIKLEYNQVGDSSFVHLTWRRNSRGKHVIPQTRLYPDGVATAQLAIISATSAMGFVNRHFSF